MTPAWFALYNVLRYAGNTWQGVRWAQKPSVSNSTQRNFNLIASKSTFGFSKTSQFIEWQVCLYRGCERSRAPVKLQSSCPLRRFGDKKQTKRSCGKVYKGCVLFSFKTHKLNYNSDSRGMWKRRTSPNLCERASERSTLNQLLFRSAALCRCFTFAYGRQN